MTSFRAKKIIQNGFMLKFKVQGQVYHLVESFLPPAQNEQQFLQIYFVGEDDREVELRRNNFLYVKPGLERQLQEMLNTHNVYVRELKLALDTVSTTPNTFQVVLNAERKPTNGHSGRYNQPTSNEVVLVIIGQQFSKLDIVIGVNDNTFHRISEIHRSYDAIQYPLLFWYGEDGYSISISQCDPKTKQPLKKMVSAASFYSYRIMIGKGEDNHLPYFRSLFSKLIRWVKR